MRVLRARGIESEAQIPFASLLELLRPALALLERLPPPQAAALEGALALRPGRRRSASPIGAATLGLLAASPRSGRWPCSSTTRSGSTARARRRCCSPLRRLVADPIAVVLAVRAGEPSLLDGADLPVLRARRAQRATRPRSCSRASRPPAVARLHRATGGNPLALLELRDRRGRARARARGRARCWSRRASRRPTRAARRLLGAATRARARPRGDERQRRPGAAGARGGRARASTSRRSPPPRARARRARRAARSRSAIRWPARRCTRRRPPRAAARRAPRAGRRPARPRRRPPRLAPRRRGASGPTRRRRRRSSSAGDARPRAQRVRRRGRGVRARRAARRRRRAPRAAAARGGGDRVARRASAERAVALLDEARAATADAGAARPRSTGWRGTIAVRRGPVMRGHAMLVATAARGRARRGGGDAGRGGLRLPLRRRRGARCSPRRSAPRRSPGPALAALALPRRRVARHGAGARRRRGGRHEEHPRGDRARRGGAGAARRPRPPPLAGDRADLPARGGRRPRRWSTTRSTPRAGARPSARCRACST